VPALDLPSYREKSNSLFEKLEKHIDGPHGEEIQVAQNLRKLLQEQKQSRSC